VQAHLYGVASEVEQCLCEDGGGRFRLVLAITSSSDGSGDVGPSGTGLSSEALGDLVAATGVTLRYGRLTETMLREVVPDASAREVYLCGPDSMMTAAQKLLIVELGVAPAALHQEKFDF
jgi:NAD(P)H-flavin reductase